MIRFAFLLALAASSSLAMAQETAGQHGGVQHGQHLPGMCHADQAMNAAALPEGVTEGGQSAFAAPFRRSSSS